MTERHYVLLPTPAWAGPNGFLTQGPKTDMHRGVKVDPALGPFRYELRVDAKAKKPLEFPPLDLHHPGKGQLLMSPKMLSSLKRAGVDNLQLFPVDVVYTATGATPEYKIVNILGVIKALDTASSECKVDEDGFVENFTTLRFAEKQIAGHRFFRMYESFHTLVISEAVKNALEEDQITGITILKDEEWEPGML
jgi:hypothetical protein